MRKLLTIVALISLMGASSAQGQRDTTASFGGMDLAGMRIEVKFHFYGDFSGSRRNGPNDLDSWSGTGQLAHGELLELSDPSFRYKREGDLITISSGDGIYGSVLYFTYDSANGRLLDLGYSQSRGPGNHCFGEFVTHFRMTETPIREEAGKLVVDPYLSDGWRERVLSWAYLRNEECPVPYHSSYSNYARGDSLISPIEIIFAPVTAAVDRTRDRSISWRSTDDGLTLCFAPLDQPATITVTDILGRSQFNGEVPTGASTFTIPGSELPPSLFFVRFLDRTLKVAR